MFWIITLVVLNYFWRSFCFSILSKHPLLLLNEFFFKFFFIKFALSKFVFFNDIQCFRISFTQLNF